MKQILKRGKEWKFQNSWPDNYWNLLKMDL